MSTTNKANTTEPNDGQIKVLALVCEGLSTIKALTTRTRKAYGTINGQVLSLYTRGYVEFADPDPTLKENTNRRGRKSITIKPTAAGQAYVRKVRG